MTAEKIGKQPAFPLSVVQPDGFATWDSGLTKRELFIALALQATLPGSSSYEAAARGAVFAADATLAYLANESEVINGMKSRAQEESDRGGSITFVTPEMVDNLEKMAVGNWLQWYSDKYECGVDEAEIAYVDTARESRSGPPSDESAIFGGRKTTGIAMIPPLKDMG